MNSFLKACSSGNFELVKTLSSQEQDWDKGMGRACERGHLEIVKFLIAKGARDWSWGRIRACEHGHMEIVKFLIAYAERSGEKGHSSVSQRGASSSSVALAEPAREWDYGMGWACNGGHLEIVKLMIEKGATDWDYGMANACKRGHLEIVKFMIEKGACDWNRGMANACSGGSLQSNSTKPYLEIVKLMIEKGRPSVSQRGVSGSAKPAICWKLNQENGKKLVCSLSFQELCKYRKLKTVPSHVQIIIQKRIYFRSQIKSNMISLERNLFPVLECWIKN